MRLKGLSPEVATQDRVFARVEDNLDVFTVRSAGYVVVHRLPCSVRRVELDTHQAGDPTRVVRACQHASMRRVSDTQCASG